VTPTCEPPDNRDGHGLAVDPCAARPSPRAQEAHGHHGHGHGAGHGHDHGIVPGADVRYLSTALALIGLFMVAEVVTALVAHSLALLADAGHMLTDVGAIGASIWAAGLAARPAAGEWTYGWKRAEILSAALNGMTLVVVSALVLFESVHRLWHPGAVHGLPMTAVAVVGMAVNVAAAWTLARANRTSLNVEGAYRHVVTDLYGFAATAVAGAVVLASGWDRADAVASLVVVALMVKAAWGLLAASGRILLEAAPEDVDLAEVRSHLLQSGHVRDVHDLHVWTLTSALPTLSAHVVVSDACFRDGHLPQVLDQLQACLVGHFDVEHCTFQLEPAGHLDHEVGTH
jgi:cobalt-zinc-cadmium efflux system protein